MFVHVKFEGVAGVDVGEDQGREAATILGGELVFPDGLLGTCWIISVLTQTSAICSRCRLRTDISCAPSWRPIERKKTHANEAKV